MSRVRSRRPANSANAEASETTTRWVLREVQVTYKRGEKVAAPRAIASSYDVVALVRASEELRHLPTSLREHFVVFALDAKNKVVGYEITGGGASTCPADPKAIFTGLLTQGATGAILVHNHPSGDPTPSADDIALTERLRKGAELLGLRILDHVVVGYDGFFSFLDHGLLPDPTREA